MTIEYPIGHKRRREEGIPGLVPPEPERLCKLCPIQIAYTACQFRSLCNYGLVDLIKFSSPCIFNEWVTF